MSDAVVVAIITVALSGVFAVGGTFVGKLLNRNHDQAVIDDLVTARMSRELERVYHRVDELESDIKDLRMDRERADARAENSERDAKVARGMAADFLAHIEKLERMVPPPPPPRPWVGKDTAA